MILTVVRQSYNHFNLILISFQSHFNYISFNGQEFSHNQDKCGHSFLSDCNAVTALASDAPGELRGERVRVIKRNFDRSGWPRHAPPACGRWAARAWEILATRTRDRRKGTAKPHLGRSSLQGASLCRLCCTVCATAFFKIILKIIIEIESKIIGTAAAVFHEFL